MIGCRPLTNAEIDQILVVLPNTRDRALFILGIKTGFRISELLSLQIKDVYQHGHVVDHITVQRKHMKGAQSSRTVPVHSLAKLTIAKLVEESKHLPVDAALFRGQKHHTKSYSRFQAWYILKQAYETVGLSGKLATHSMRKTFASNIYQKLDKDIVSTQQALGHKSIASTVSYLSFDRKKIDKAILE